MRIVLYFINYNDSFYFPFIKEHYGKFCEQMIMYDNYSSDDSVKLAKSLGFEVRKYGKRGQFNDQHFLDVKNNCWKEQKGKGIDYVIVCDADEFITQPKTKCATPVVTGFNMVSEFFPKKSVFEINTGVHDAGYSKQAIFNPDAVLEINYHYGCHENSKQVIQNDACNENVFLYHYRHIGGVQPILEKQHIYRKRMSKFNKKRQLSYHYMLPDIDRINYFEHLKSNAQKLWE